jgi:hypothetical protein
MMDERDYWGIIIILALMTAEQWLHARAIAKLQADVAFLRDVARETDALRSDHE